MTTQEHTFTFSQLKTSLGNIYKHSEQYKGKLIFIFFLIVVSSIVEALHPYIWGRLVDLIVAKNVNEAFVVLGIYATITLIQMFADLRKSLVGRWVEESIRRSYIATSFDHLFKLPLSFHKSVKQGETNEKIRTAGQAIRNIYSNAILEAVPQVITTVVMCIIMIFSNLIFATIIICALILYIYISIREIKPTFALQKLSQKGYRKASGMTQDAITNIRSVKDFNTEEYETSRIIKVYKEEGFHYWYQMFSIQRTTNNTLGLIRTGVRFVIISLSIYLISRGQITVGNMLSYITYSTLIFQPLAQLFNNWRDIQNGIVSIDEAQKILDMDPEKYTSDIPHSEILGKVSFNNVDFYYDETNPVLKEISFVAEKGQTIALVGESGVGKSTLVDLLLGYHFAKKGSVFIDNTNVTEMDLSLLRRSIAVVSQEISLFNDTIKNNIAYGSFEKSEEEIKDAARKAHCTDFIEKFPEKWEQIVGEKGLKLSVGQKQRVAIARAILKDPKILILDEPTSALDAGSEKIITESFKELMKGRTTFIIAHRLSTVRRANTILTFKDGMIIEQGTHDGLMKIEGGEYRRLYELQIGLHD